MSNYKNITITINTYYYYILLNKSLKKANSRVVVGDELSPKEKNSLYFN